MLLPTIYPRGKTMTDELTALLHQQMPVAVTLGMTADQAGPDHVAIRLPWSEQLCTDGGRIHGGVIMTLADSAGGVCAFFNLPDGATGTTTIESKSNFFKAVTEGDVVASARPLHTGSTTIVVETEVRNGEHLVAKVTQTQTISRAT